MCSPWDSVTEAHLAAALAIDKGNEAAFVSWSFRASPEPFKHQRIAEVKYALEGQEGDVTYSVKCVGRGAGADECHALLFEKEYGFYEELAPAINTLLQETGQRSLRIPRCFTHARTETYEVMVLEDLSTRGFRAADRSFGLDLAHVLLAVQEIARLHAASFLLQSRSADKPLAQTYPFVGKEWTKVYKRGGESYEDILTKHMDLAVAIVEEMPKREKQLTWLKESRPKVWEMFLEQLVPKKPFEVLCLGDGWSSNILFRYDSLDMPIEAIFMDMQQVRIASPATDMQSLIAPHLTSLTRTQENDSLQIAYHDTFRRVMEAGGGEVPFSTVSLSSEYRAKSLCGFLSALMYIPLAVQKDGGSLHPLSEEAGALTKDKEQVLEALKKDRDLIQRLLSLLDEGEKHGMLHPPSDC